MKKWLLTLVVVSFSVFLISPTWAHEAEMCPGHSGTTLESLVMCISHAAADGHIANAGITNSLIAKLENAQAAWDRGQGAVAVNLLEAFIKEVLAQAGKHIHAEHAHHLHDHAERVIEALGG